MAYSEGGFHRIEPVRTIADFKTLDEGEVLEGYLDGFSGLMPTAPTRSRAYWHGWRNGMIESERHPPDEAYIELQQAFERKRKAH
jgi:hypothetical protein